MLCRVAHLWYDVAEAAVNGPYVHTLRHLLVRSLEGVACGVWVEAVVDNGEAVVRDGLVRRLRQCRKDIDAEQGAKI